MIHNLSYRAFVYGTESEDKVKEAIYTLIPSAQAEKEITEGYHSNQVIILHGKIIRKREIKDFLKKLQSLNPSTKKKIFKELENNELIKATMTNVKLGEPMPNIPEMNAFWKHSITALENITSGKAGAKEALHEAAGNVAAASVSR